MHSMAEPILFMRIKPLVVMFQVIFMTDSYLGVGVGFRKQDEKVVALEARLLGAGVDIQFPYSCLICCCQLCFIRSH